MSEYATREDTLKILSGIMRDEGANSATRIKAIELYSDMEGYKKAAKSNAPMLMINIAPTSTIKADAPLIDAEIITQKPKAIKEADEENRDKIGDFLTSEEQSRVENVLKDTGIELPRPKPAKNSKEAKKRGRKPKGEYNSGIW